MAQESENVETSAFERGKRKQELEDLARFPAENPNPVLRLSREGELLYANPASVPLLSCWNCRRGKTVPEKYTAIAREALASAKIQRTEIGCEKQVFSLTFAPVVPSGYVNVYGLDITEQKKAEADVKNISIWWQATFDSIADLVSIQDKDFKLVRVNKAYENAVKMGMSDLIGKRCFEIVHGTTCPPEGCPHAQTVTTGKAASKELFEPRLGVYLEASTSPIYDDKGELMGCVHFAKDITLRKQAEQALLREKNFSDAVIDSLPGFFYIIDRNGNFVRCNKDAEKVTGYSLKELTGSHALTIIAAKDKEYIAGKIQTVFTAGYADAEANLLTKSGKEVPHFFTGARAFIGDNTYLLGMGIDISERKQGEEEVIQLNRALNQRANELEAANRELEAFSYSVSHDLRAPLRTMAGFSQALLEDYNAQLDEQGKDFLRRIDAGSQRMAELIDNLLELSRVTRAELLWEPVNLSEIAYEVADELKKTGTERPVEIIIQPGMNVSGDATLLRLVLENLLGNAWKFTSKSTGAKIEFGMEEESGEKHFFVKDNGAGFDMAYADKLFKPFHRLHTPEQYPGTGIGLAIVERVIHRLGGRVWAQSQPGEGAAFYFSLPSLLPLS